MFLEAVGSSHAWFVPVRQVYHPTHPTDVTVLGSTKKAVLACTESILHATVEFRSVVYSSADISLHYRRSVMVYVYTYCSSAARSLQTAHAACHELFMARLVAYFRMTWEAQIPAVIVVLASLRRP